jgi:hypothetical protein
MKHYVRDSEIITVVERLLKNLIESANSIQTSVSNINSNIGIGNGSDASLNESLINGNLYTINKGNVDATFAEVITLLKTLVAEIGVSPEVISSGNALTISSFLSQLLYQAKERVPIPISDFASGDYSNNGLFSSTHNHSVIDYLKAIVAILGQPDISPYPNGQSLLPLVTTDVQYNSIKQWLSPMTGNEYSVPSHPSGSSGVLILNPDIYKQVIFENRTASGAIYIQESATTTVNFQNSIRILPNEKLSLAPFYCTSPVYALATGGTKTLSVVSFS